MRKGTKRSLVKKTAVSKKKVLPGKKKISAKKRSVSKKRTSLVLRLRRKSKRAAVKQEIPLRDMKVEAAKFYMGPVRQTAATRSGFAVQPSEGELPARYDEDVIVLLVRDPWWVHIYWDVSQATLENLKSEHAEHFKKSSWILRAYDISFIQFNGENAHRFIDTPIRLEAGNWFLNLGAPGTSWCVDLGILLPGGRFIKVLRSNVISLPLDGPSWITDEEWMIPDDDFRQLYGMSVGLGPNVSSPVGKLWRERLKKDISSGAFGSFGSPVKRPQTKAQRPFWLTVHTELIVYGATEPDADVKVQGRKVALRKDGTFTLRFMLPDGKQVIGVQAESSKTGEKRKITPVVARETR